MLGVATVDVVNVNREGDIVFGRMPYHCKTPVNSVCNGADLHDLSYGGGRLKSVGIPHVHSDLHVCLNKLLICVNSG